MLCARALFSVTGGNGAGYICAVLYLIPGFHFITSVLDLAKLDMRSGIERLTYSVVVVLVATACVWAAGLLFGFESETLSGLELPFALLIALRLAASFIGVYGIAVSCNGTHRMALAAALVGTLPNVLRIELGELLQAPAPIAAFCGALLVGLLAPIAVRRTGFPRMAVTVPCVSVSVPGFYMYKAIYYFGTGAAEAGLNALLRACGVIFALALGILFAKCVTEPRFRKKD